MKFTMKGADLYEAVRHLAPIARTSLDPPNRRIRIRCSNGRVEFTVVGRTLSVRRSAEFTGEPFEGHGVVDADVLRKLATRLKKHEVVMEPKVSGEMVVTAGHHSVVFPAAEGPNAQSTPDCAFVAKLPAVTFKDVLAAALPFASDDDRRPALCGVYVDGVASDVNVTATNGAVLYTRTVPDFEGFVSPFIIPADLLKVALKLADARDEPVTVRHSDSEIALEQAGRFEVTGSAVGATYPDFRACLPDPARNPVALFESQAMLDALDAGRPFLSRSEAVRVSYNGAITVEVAGESGDFFAEIGGEYDGGPARTLAFNTAYLALACRTLQADPLRQYVASSLEPQVFTSDADDNGVQVVVMPMRL